MSKFVKTLDTQPFEGLIAEALQAYKQDFSYAEAIAKQARGLKNKRAAVERRNATKTNS